MHAILSNTVCFAAMHSRFLLSVEFSSPQDFFSLQPLKLCFDSAYQLSFNLSVSIRNGCVMTPRKWREAERNEHSSPIETMKNYANKSRSVMTARQTSVASLIAVLIAGCP